MSYDTPDIKTDSCLSKHEALQDPALEMGHRSQKDDVRRRVEELRAAEALKYPRMKGSAYAISCANFRAQYDFVKPQESREDEIVTLRGMVLDT